MEGFCGRTQPAKEVKGERFCATCRRRPGQGAGRSTKSLT